MEAEKALEPRYQAAQDGSGIWWNGHMHINVPWDGRRDHV